MEYKSYDDFVAAHLKPGKDIAHNLSTEGQFMLMNALAFASWTGSQIDLVKKKHIYQKADVEDAQLLNLHERDLMPVEDLTAYDLNLIHTVLGMVGEACEIAESLFKTYHEGGEIDRANMREEIGDIEFFMSGFRQALKLSREHALDENMAKLMKRHASGRYSDAGQIGRADKAEETKPEDEITTCKRCGMVYDAAQEMSVDGLCEGCEDQT